MAALQGSTCWAHPNAHVRRWEELEPRLPKSTSGSSKSQGSQQLPCSMPRETPEQCQLWLLMTLCLGTQKENLTFFFSIGEVTIHIQLFPCTWVSLELVIQDTEKEKSLLLPTLKVSLLAHANKGGRVFSAPPPREDWDSGPSSSHLPSSLCCSQQHAPAAQVLPCSARHKARCWWGPGLEPG